MPCSIPATQFLGFRFSSLFLRSAHQNSFPKKKQKEPTSYSCFHFSHNYSLLMFKRQTKSHCTVQPSKQKSTIHHSNRLPSQRSKSITKKVTKRTARTPLSSSNTQSPHYFTTPTHFLQSIPTYIPFKSFSTTITTPKNNNNNNNNNKSKNNMSTQESAPQTDQNGQSPQGNTNTQRHNLTPEEVTALREQRKKAQQEKSALNNNKKKDHQNNNNNTNKDQKKPISTNSKDFGSIYSTTFPNDTYEYVDTHVHIDAILGRMNRGASKKDAKGCCGEEIPQSTVETATTTTADAETTPETPTDSTATSTTTSADATKPITHPKVKELEWTVNRLNSEAHLGNFSGAVTVCCEPESYEDVMAVLDSDKSGKIYAAFGIHPHESSKWNDEIEKKFEKAMEHPKVIAWGECGLDYYYEHSPKDVQKPVFIRQIQLAVKHNKPLVVHTREAEADTVEIMIKHVPKEHFIHVHCCTSSVNMVKPLIEHFPNLFIGFTGCITFKNNDQIIQTLASVPIERLLLETDGPYMAPLPFRGAVAHSGMIPFTAVRMAQVKEVDLETLLTQVRSNTKSIYGF